MWSLPFDYQEIEKKLNDRIEEKGGWTAVVMLMVVMMMKVKGLFSHSHCYKFFSLKLHCIISIFILYFVHFTALLRRKRMIVSWK